ncbi:MAG: bifunctional 23S rRNA (guanine(2069)-N(7))-methyltransferase RlmK/23S rRNA (guanine(2445)-N(2))-methyltransferase RlmL [Spirochaetia bacterium]
MDNNTIHHFFAYSGKFTEDVTADEISSYGGVGVRARPGGVYFMGTIETAYKACLYSRTASKILLLLTELPVETIDDLYSGLRKFDFTNQLSLANTFAVEATVRNKSFPAPNYTALKTKDAIADSMRDKLGMRPSVNAKAPDLLFHIHVENERALFYLDLSGESLFKRGYRKELTEAPLKETTAAAILIRAGWKEIAENGGSLLDPMCGSGTFSIEAALMGLNIAPGLLREKFGFENWKYHDAELWNSVREQASNQAKNPKHADFTILMSDVDKNALNAAQANAKNAGIKEVISVRKSDFRNRTRFPGVNLQEGLIVINPPYGERLLEGEDLANLYAGIGKRLAEDYKGWKAAILAPEEDFVRALGLKVTKKNRFMNGKIPCNLLQITIDEDNTFLPFTASRADKKATRESREMFRNRIKKNLADKEKWAKEKGITCYRLYDADMPEYNMSVDIYEGGYLHVQEYAPPKSVPRRTSEKRLSDALTVLKKELDVPSEKCAIKQKKPQKGKNQYGKQDFQENFITVHEGGLAFKVNLFDYLDTGIFLDHRPMRNRIRSIARGKSVLNLFSYTCTVSVYAAAGGAKKAVSVDSSRTYLEWGKENFSLNNIHPRAHIFLRADCTEWLKDEEYSYDIIFCDPPTFSNAKNRDLFDVQKDHAQLITLCMKRLNTGGTLYFSTNFRRFTMDDDISTRFAVKDITEETTPYDFQGSKRTHQCYEITRH